MHRLQQGGQHVQRGVGDGVTVPLQRPHHLQADLLPETAPGDARVRGQRQVPPGNDGGGGTQAGLKVQ